MEYRHLLKRNSRLLKLDSKRFKLLFLAFIIGAISGLIGSLFRKLLFWFEHLRNYLSDNPYIEQLWIKVILVLIFTITSIFIALTLVRRFAPEAGGSGIQEIEGALDGIREIRWKRVIPVKFFASVFSLGSGLLLGREGPTIQLGANVGKMIKDLFKQPDKENNPLISTGAAAGLASAFNAPLSGIIFVIEEMNDQFKFNFYSVAAIMIGAGTSDVVQRLIMGSEAVISMKQYTYSDNVSMLWFFGLSGVIFGFIGFVFNRLTLWSLNLTEKWSLSIWSMAIITGTIITVIGFLYPDMIGANSETIYKILDHSFSLLFLVVLFIVRFGLTIFSYSTGSPGGIFAPMLILGVILGSVFGLIMQSLFPDIITEPGVFALAGMAGMFSSTVRAPLTGLALAVEMTSNYGVILPLILTTVAASVTTTMIGNRPIYTSLLRRTIYKQMKSSKTCHH